MLIVDDDLDIREALVEVLEDRGFPTLTAANGREALHLLRTTAVPPSVILLDLMMPIMDGYGLLDELDQDAELSAIPVAIITAGQRVDHRRIGDRAQIVPKPISLSKLLGILHRLEPDAGATPS